MSADAQTSDTRAEPLEDMLGMLNDAPVRVSVVVPTRRRPQPLYEALVSIRALETPLLSFEILVCDNGEGADVARRFGATYLTVDRLGASAARNAGMLAATGEYLAFLDDDDLWAPGHLAPKIALLQARPELDAVVGQTITTDEMRIPLSAPWPPTLPETGDVFQHFLHEYPQMGSTVVRTAVRETVGLFDEELLGDEDWDWRLRLALTHQVGFVPAPGVLFRQRPAGSFDDLQWSRSGSCDASCSARWRRGAGAARRCESACASRSSTTGSTAGTLSRAPAATSRMATGEPPGTPCHARLARRQCMSSLGLGASACSASCLGVDARATGSEAERRHSSRNAGGAGRPPWHG